MVERETGERLIGRSAWVMAWAGLVGGQLHALSRYATEDGKGELEMALVALWAVPARDLLSPLLTWADPDLVYVTYGKIWFPVFAAFTLCAYVVHRRRQPVGVEGWAWRAFLLGCTVGTFGVLLEYWTQWTGSYAGDGIEARIFSLSFVLAVLALPLIVLGATALGVVLLTKSFRPVLPALLLAAVIPLDLLIAQATSMGSLLLPVMFAFAILGRRLARPAAPAPSGALPRASATA